MNEREMKERTKQFGLRSIKLVEALPRNRTSDVLGKQLLRSATSVGANYRAACRAKSRADMAAKLANVEEETDESAHWIEMIADAGLMRAEKIAPLLHEANELVCIVVASIKTLRRTPQIQNPKSEF